MHRARAIITLACLVGTTTSCAPRAAAGPAAEGNAPPTTTAAPPAPSTARAQPVDVRIDRKLMDELCSLVGLSESEASARLASTGLAGVRFHGKSMMRACAAPPTSEGECEAHPTVRYVMAHDTLRAGRVTLAGIAFAPERERQGLLEVDALFPTAKRIAETTFHGGTIHMRTSYDDHYVLVATLNTGELSVQCATE